jgi:hypothetical protein
MQNKSFKERVDEAGFLAFEHGIPHHAMRAVDSLCACWREIPADVPNRVQLEDHIFYALNWLGEIVETSPANEEREYVLQEIHDALLNWRAVGVKANSSA